MVLNGSLMLPCATCDRWCVDDSGYVSWVLKPHPLLVYKCSALSQWKSVSVRVDEITALDKNETVPTSFKSALHCSSPQDDDISGVVRYRTYEVLKAEANNPRLRWAYLPYSMHMAGPREAIQHMIIRKNYGEGVDGGNRHKIRQGGRTLHRGRNGRSV